MEGQEHFYMETQTILAVPPEEDKEMVLHVGTQFQTHVQVTVFLENETPDGCVTEALTTRLSPLRAF